MVLFSISKFICSIIESIETKKICPLKDNRFILPNSSEITSTFEILVAKNKALKTTPATTPKAKLCVIKTIITVISITTASVFGAFLIYLKEFQSNVPIETITIIPAKIGIGT